MIIKVENIRKVRPIAQNISSIDRIDTYIKEVETLFCIAQFGAALYKRINDDAEEFKDLIDGCYYNEDTAYCEGLSSAVAYLVYSRFIMSQQLNVTALGVVFKQGEMSERVDDTTLIRASKQAEKIGLEYLGQCVDYLKFKGEINANVRKIRKCTIKIIGD